MAQIISFYSTPLSEDTCSAETQTISHKNVSPFQNDGNLLNVSRLHKMVNHA